MLVRYYGPVGIPSGYGYAANEACMSLITAGVDLEIQTYSPTGAAFNYLPMRYGALASLVRNDGVPPRPNPDVVIVHTLPSGVATVLEVAKIRTLYPKALCVAYTSWEANSISTTLVEGLAQFDQVWVPSTGVQETLQRTDLVASRVFVVPHAYDEVSSAWQPPDPPRAADAPFTFYYVGAWSHRKNPQGVIRAFLRAFGNHFDHRDLNRHPHLLVHAPGADPIECSRVIVAATGKNPSEFPIILSTKYLPDEELAVLHQTCQCFVTASRGEAWLLPAFDAMIARRHIIYPKMLGCADYLRGTSAWSYRSRISPAGGDARIHTTADGRTGIVPVGTDITVSDDWWEPDIDDLAGLMRKAYLEQVSTLEIHYDPAERYGRRAVGALMMRLLREGPQG